MKCEQDIPSGERTIENITTYIRALTLTLMLSKSINDIEFSYLLDAVELLEGIKGEDNE